MSYAVEFTEAALRDLEGIVDFITLGSSSRGTAFVESLLERVRNKIGAFPRSGKVIGAHRFTVFSGYVVVYTIEEARGRAIVVLVTEGHRDWRAALEKRG